MNSSHGTTKVKQQRTANATVLIGLAAAPLVSKPQRLCLALGAYAVPEPERALVRGSHTRPKTMAGGSAVAAPQQRTIRISTFVATTDVGPYRGGWCPRGDPKLCVREAPGDADWCMRSNDGAAPPPGGDWGALLAKSRRVVGCGRPRCPRRSSPGGALSQPGETVSDLFTVGILA